MHIKYTILFGALVALTGMSCSGSQTPPRRRPTIETPPKAPRRAAVRAAEAGPMLPRTNNLNTRFLQSAMQQNDREAALDFAKLRGTDTSYLSPVEKETLEEWINETIEEALYNDGPQAILPLIKYNTNISNFSPEQQRTVYALVNAALIGAIDSGDRQAAQLLTRHPYANIYNLSPDQWDKLNELEALGG